MIYKKLLHSLRVVIVLIFSIFIFNCTMTKQQVAPLYIEKDIGSYQIPELYDSYTLFFATSFYYTDNLSLQDAKAIKTSLKRFGKSIGSKNLVVWVKNPKDGNLNVAMGQTYADRLNRWYLTELGYSNGPYLVYLTHHPDKRPEESDFAVIISFSDKSIKYSIEAIEYLQMQIRRKKVQKEDIMVRNYWIDLKSIVSSNKDLLIDIAKNHGSK